MAVSKEIENELPECSWVCVRKGKEICVVKKPAAHIHCITVRCGQMWKQLESLQMDVWIQKVW